MCRSVMVMNFASHKFRATPGQRFTGGYFSIVFTRTWVDGDLCQPWSAIVLRGWHKLENSIIFWPVTADTYKKYRR